MIGQETFMGKVALVTGASNGIGRETASILAARGASVVLADIDEPNGVATATSIKEAGGEALFQRTDVTQSEQVAAAVDATLDRFGRLDFAVNSAGISLVPARIADTSEARFDEMIDVALKGVWLGMRYEIPAIVRNLEGGAIVNIASAAGLIGVRFGVAAYVASKHAVVGLTKVAALEYGPDGLRANALCPGAINTAMYDESLDAGVLTEKQAIDLHPLGRLGVAQDVAQAAVWLCSNESSFITGAALPIDGGLTAGR